ncbi:hypothetical protein LDENG_00244830, partial [Lucifuga dentata]
MADPLRRTLLAKLRGKKSKKGATVGGGYDSAAAAAAANGGREGGVRVRESRAELAQAGPRQPASGGRGRVNEELLGVSLQRDAQIGGLVFREGDRSHQGSRFAGEVTISMGVPLGGPHAQRKHFISVPRQCSVGDSIGFGDSSNHVLYRAQVEMHSGVEGSVSCNGAKMSRSKDGTEIRDRGLRHMAGNVLAVNERNANWTFDSNQTLETNSPACAPLVHPNRISGNTEENILIRNIESYGSSPELIGDIRGTSLQSPTFFPTELEICDLSIREGSLRHHSLHSEDDDYYDNEILPFYETIKVKSDGDRGEVRDLSQPEQDKGQADDSSSAQETDRLRNQLKEAYYLLINAMNDINLDVQQFSGGLTDQQAASSCSSRSRDSLCSRLSAKNMDSDSWSSGGDHSPQQVSDTDSLLLCLSGNLESCLKSRLNSKSMVNLATTHTRPALLRSVSDGAIRYPSGYLQASGTQSSESGDDNGAAEPKGEKEPEGAKVTGVCELSDTQAVDDAASSDEVLQDAGGEDDCGGQLNESSGSVNSLTGSSDSNPDASTSQSHNNKQELSGMRAQGGNSVNKGHGVTVNKMQEWMHKGRLLSSEMKQRIEGSSSSLPRGGQSQDRSCAQVNPEGCKTGAQNSSWGARGGKPAKAKSLSPSRGEKPAIKSPQQSASSAQQQPAFIENVQAPCAIGREAGRANELPWRPPLNTITVSKKRNWLQQSSLGKPHCTQEEPQGALGAEEESSQGSYQLPPPPSPSPDQLRPAGGVSSGPHRLHLPQVSVGQARVSPQPRSVDPTEENDADDEGEIWYNPIPEDDEVETCHRPAIRLLVPPRKEPQTVQRRPSRGGDAGHGGRVLEGTGGARPEGLGESLGGGGGDGSQGNAVHSTETLHLHRQMLACKPQEEGGPSVGRATGKAKKYTPTHTHTHTHFLILTFIPFLHLSPNLLHFFGPVLEGQLLFV